MPTTLYLLSVLIVDDCPDMVASGDELLAHYGYEVRTAENTIEALALIEDWELRVALLYLAMPGMNGYELAQSLGVRCGMRPLLVAVTGLATERYQEQEVARGYGHALRDCFGRFC